MLYCTPNGFGLQSLLFSTTDLSSCFFHEPSEREMEFMHYYQGILDLLSADELKTPHRK